MPDVGANGKIAPCLGLFSLSAFALSMCATFACKFISANSVDAWTDYDSKPNHADFPDDKTVSQGFWAWEVSGGADQQLNTDGCQSYPDRWGNYDLWDYPSQFDAARAFSVITVILGIVLMVIGCAVVCMPMPAAMFKCLGVAFFFQTLFEGLKFLIVIDRNNYSLEYGANCCIAATSLYFVCMIMSCVIKPPDEEESGESQGKVVNESEKDEEPKNEETPEPDEEAPKAEEE